MIRLLVLKEDQWWSVIGGFYTIGPSSLEFPNTEDNIMCFPMNQLNATCSFDLNKVMKDGNGVPGEEVIFYCKYKLVKPSQHFPHFLAITCIRRNTTKLGSSM